MSNALDPVTCGRCKREVAADDPARPVHVSGRTWRPQNPRPTWPTGEEVRWSVEADYDEHDLTVSIMLCAPCIADLNDWLYQWPASR